MNLLQIFNVLTHWQIRITSGWNFITMSHHKGVGTVHKRRLLISQKSILFLTLSLSLTCNGCQTLLPFKSHWSRHILLASRFSLDWQHRINWLFLSLPFLLLLLLLLTVYFLEGVHDNSQNQIEKKEWPKNHQEAEINSRYKGHHCVL